MNALLRIKLIAILLLFAGHQVSAMLGEADEYTLTINIVGNGSVEIQELDPDIIAKSISQSTDMATTECDYSEQPCISTWYDETQLVLEAIPGDGWEFAGWTSSSGSSSVIVIPVQTGELNGGDEFFFLSMFADQIVTATFTIIEYELNTFAELPDGGNVSVDPEKDNYNYGDIVELTAEANPGFIFLYWSGNFQETSPVTKSSTSGNNPISIRIEDDTDITANFGPLQAIPLSKWTIVLGMAMMLAFFVYRFR